MFVPGDALSQQHLWLAPAPAPSTLRIAPAMRPLVKRVFDIMAVLISTPLLLPVVAAAALCLILTGQRPFYVHTRIGRGGVSFRCLKLRTMDNWPEARFAALLGSDPALAQEFRTTGKLARDPRVSRLGHWLRRSSIDELPQALNVLLGQMSIVGPRPITRAELDGYLDHQRQAYESVRPGVTGLWQVSGRSGLTLRQRARLDTRYARTPSLSLDLSILLRTIPVVLRGTGV